MSGDVTRGGGNPPLVVVEALSPELRKILQRRRVVTDYGGEDASEGGAQYRDGAWIRPDWVDLRERDEARAKLAGYEIHLRPVSHDRIRQFLLFLWNATKHHGDMTWKVVAELYPMMLDNLPAWCFRDERLKLAATQAFQWFPSVKELADFMDPDRRKFEELIEQLRVVASTTTKRPEGPRDTQARDFRWSREEAEEHAKRLYDRKAKERRELMEQLGIEPTPVPPRAPGETDREYASRMVEHVHRECDIGGRWRERENARQRRERESASRPDFDVLTGEPPVPVRAQSPRDQDASPTGEPPADAPSGGEEGGT